jgi:hypothetical protein
MQSRKTTYNNSTEGYKMTDSNTLLDVILKIVAGGVLLLIVIKLGLWWNSRPANSDANRLFIHWIIPKVIGWVWVSDDEQVVVINDKVHTKSGLFVCSLTRVPSTKAISLTWISDTIISTAILTKDGNLIDVSVPLKYRLQAQYAQKLILEHNTINSLHQSLKAAISTYIKTHNFSDLKEHHGNTLSDLESFVQGKIRNYEIEIEDIDISGDVIILVDKINRDEIQKDAEISQAEKTIRIAQIDKVVKEIEAIPEIRQELVRQVLPIYLAQLARGTIRGSDNELKQLVRDIMGSPTGQLDPRDVVVNIYPDEIIAVDPYPALPRSEPIQFAQLAKEPMRLIREDENFHQLAYHGYQIRVDTGNFPDVIQLEIKAPTGKSIHKSQRTFLNPGNILISIKEIIDQDEKGENSELDGIIIKNGGVV